MTPIPIAELLDRYDGVLLDVYGVLLDGAGPLPGARELIAELVRRGQPFAIVTNDASRSAETYAERFARLGLPIGAERIVTSGSLLPAHLRALGPGLRTCVLGTADSLAYARAGGAIPVTLARGMEIDALAVCDDEGFEFLAGTELALSAVVRAMESGRRPALILPNPDLVYPKSAGELGLTAGAIALVIEAVLARRFPGAQLVFDRLGKPSPHLFAAAARLLDVPRLVMIGDQLETDIAGAHAAGIDAAWLAGITREIAGAIAPTWILEGLAP
jgi:HAD superfamily hydrolase (TIGR01450 family)